MPTTPTPDRIFEGFKINPDNIKLIVVGDKTFTEEARTPYNQFNPQLKEIWDILEREEIFEEEVEKYLQPDLSYWTDCLILPTSLTEKQEDVWKDFMKYLFEWFDENGNYYIFCFLTNKAFEYAKYVKKHNIIYQFQPKLIQEELIKQWGNQYISYWGLPF